MSSESFSVRRAVIGDEPVLRELRLRAMIDAPEAFGSTYERELARTTDDWQRWMSPGVTFILEHAAGAAGLVAGQRDTDDPAVVNLMAMWVDRPLRGSGAAEGLVTAIVAWAEAQEATVVRLCVIKSNTRAQRCYERNGFRLTGHEETRQADGRIEIRMERPC